MLIVELKGVFICVELNMVRQFLIMRMLEI